MIETKDGFTISCSLIPKIHIANLTTFMCCAALVQLHFRNESTSFSSLKKF